MRKLIDFFAKATDKVLDNSEKPTMIFLSLFGAYLAIQIILGLCT